MPPLPVRKINSQVDSNINKTYSLSTSGDNMDIKRLNESSNKSKIRYGLGLMDIEGEIQEEDSDKYNQEMDT